MEETQLKKFSIVMEGGGMRGLYTAGVIDVLMENEIYADSAVGVSAGAVFTELFASIIAITFSAGFPTRHVIVGIL